MSDSRTIALSKQLVSRPSITPDDAGCQEIIAQLLEKLGFTITNMPFGSTSNLWASRGQGRPHFVFLGHTDVVPPGDVKLWLNDPFTPTILDNKFYGRGIADMKGGIAAMLAACEEFIENTSNHKGTISFLITSDEEGPALDGAQKVIAKLIADEVPIDWCLVGEPGSQTTFADTLKLGARGSLTGTVVFTGKQGHVGHPQKANNPIHAALNTLHSLTNIVWDEPTIEFPATNLQITNIKAGVGADNVIPETMYCQFNVRFAPTTTPDHLKKTISQALSMQALPYDIEWRLSGDAYVSPRGQLTEACFAAINEVMGKVPVLSNVGGTSDARFIVKTGCEAVEMGLLNTTIHGINEHVDCNDLEALTKIYLRILQKLMQ